jgi:hypothetical protein
MGGSAGSQTFTLADVRRAFGLAGLPLRRLWLSPLSPGERVSVSMNEAFSLTVNLFPNHAAAAKDFQSSGGVARYEGWPTEVVRDLTDGMVGGCRECVKR